MLWDFHSFIQYILIIFTPASFPYSSQTLLSKIPLLFSYFIEHGFQSVPPKYSQVWDHTLKHGESAWDHTLQEN